ncbi:flagellar biosynthetic protein FliR [Gynuella sp.]|uniref:flagellar biosynthetic protein FliR n=1 Tax=Gynuella sp. TaxID=2969146 RepID=UPI003D0C1F9E
MIELTDAQISSWVSHLLWPFFRITAFFMIVPLFGSRLVPVPIRILLSLITTLMLYPVLPKMPDIEALALTNIVIIAQQFVIGFALGFLALTLFQVFILAGQTIAMQMGLGYASMVDPANGVSVTVLSQWFLTIVTLIFVSMNGHLVVFEVLVESFYTVPVGQGFISEQGAFELAQWGGWMFASAISIALPAVASLLLVNLSFGIMARTAPAMNIFSLGFPVTMVVGLFVLWLSFSGVLSVIRTHMLELTDMMKNIVFIP